MRITVILFVLLLTGCATEPETAWYKDGSTQQSFNMDMGQCRAQSFAAPNAMNNLMQVAIIQRSCMEGKGWELRARK